ncbi:MAG: HAMP domain-containing protein [Rhodoferax sp.]|nr:HAMP domain-containing protein [Rhodoferax sp.]MBP9735764.1 HAMP domain-containing protein [Rhodoferax sp.]
MTLILLTGLLVAQGVTTWLQWTERTTVVNQLRGLNGVDRVAEVVRALEFQTPERRADALAALQYGGLHVSLIAADSASPNTPHGQFQAMLAERLGSQREIRSISGGLGLGAGNAKGAGAGKPRDTNRRRVDVRLADGQWVRFDFTPEGSTAATALPIALMVQMLISVVLVGAVVTIAVRQSTRPLQRLAQAADALGSNLDAPALAEEGPTETRRAAQAFNTMQTRIRRLVSERARALAAVSHDLRTPLTRLRLRTELIDDDSLRQQMTSDLEAMATMIDGTLDYLRGLQTQEPVRPIDINALLESMIEDALVLGRGIHLDGRALQPYQARLSALRRALQNLIDNAFKYGGSALIRVEDTTTSLNISVLDHGPGIAPENLDKVTDAYYRVDSARSRHGDGVGLGLSIVKDIALLHGGELRLTNLPQGGLSATLHLPRGQSGGTDR